MKILGAEFINFACFERQFIPLANGLSLLVGRNNAGKTAILRGLTLLSNLPVGGQLPFTASLTSYCRQQQPHPRFDFHLLFAAEASDFQHFSDADIAWGQSMCTHRPFFRFAFRVWPAQSLLSWLSVSLGTPDQTAAPIEVVSFPSNGPVLHRYSAVYRDGLPAFTDVISTTRWLFNGNMQGMPDGTYAVTIQPNAALVAELLKLKQTKLVSAHRVPHPSMNLQSAMELPTDANNLTTFLQTLQNNERRKFDAVEKFVTSVFPEFKYVNPTNRNNQSAITLTTVTSEEDIPLSHCGTGVEQLLILATFVMTTPDGSVLLMDEPHSFLHPTAERTLVDFLQSHPKQHFVVSTHSAILMNSVEPNRLTHLLAPGRPFMLEEKADDAARILHDLGYRNSDILFNDRLLAVEGESDREILRILLKKGTQLRREDIDRTGFPVIEGAGEGARALQTAAMRFEKLLMAVGRREQKRLYLFDGDKSAEDRNLLCKTQVNERHLPIVFLPRLEIENYLLSPRAIERALKEQASVDGLQLTSFGEKEVCAALKDLLASADPKLFPFKRDGDPRKNCKGSKVLDELFRRFGNQRFDKRRSGILIANLMDETEACEAAEIATLLAPIF